MVNTTLVEKYRPRSFDAVIGNDWIKEILQRMIKNDTTQHMIFVGQPGCGKTTLSRIFASKYLGIDLETSPIWSISDYRELNASDKRGIDVIRGEEVKKFCMRRAEIPDKKRILVLEEADNLTKDAQRALRAVMENNQHRVIIIMLLNHYESITEEALLSRVATFKFDPQPADKLAKYFERIAAGENIAFESQDLILDILNFPEYKGDFRRMVNDTLQKLIGIEGIVRKQDLAWIYNETYSDIIREILDNKARARYIFFGYYAKRYIDPIIFIRQFFEALKEKVKIPYKLAKVFAETQFRIKSGGDELIQLSYLLTAVEEYV